MTKRNIAIANFCPDEVATSSWPRFIGWKMVGQPVIESGLFGLVDSNIRMHRFFKDTTFKDVIQDQLVFSYRTEVKASPLRVDFIQNKAETANVILPQSSIGPVFELTWLEPYQYIDKDHVEWDVYVLIPGRNLSIDGDFARTFKAQGYWDMGIWKPGPQELKDGWNDIIAIEQATINYVVSKGYKAWKYDYSDIVDGAKKHFYKEADVTQELPGYQA